MRVLKWSLIGLAVLLVAAVLFVLFGLGTLKGPISRAVSDATGRELRIDGDIRPLWHSVHPRFRVEKVSFANPDWASEELMFTAEAVDFTVSVLPLFAGRLVLPEVHLERPRLNLEVSDDGRKNWVLDREQKEGQESRIRVQRLTLDEGRLAYDDPGAYTSIVAGLEADRSGINFSAEGKYWDLPASAAGHGGPVLSLRDADTPYPVKLAASLGSTSVRAEGSVTGVLEVAAMDMAIELRGASMEELYWAMGIAMPATSPYATSGRVVHDGKTWRYEKFTGRVGESDLSGTLQVDSSGRRPFMQGELSSKLVDLADLGVVVGTQKPREEGVLPDAPFYPERWDSVDADVRLRAGQIRRPEQLPLENLDTRIRMRDAVLTLDPLEFGAAGGKLAGTIRLDGRHPTIRAAADIRVKDLKLSKLFPTVKLAQASVGDISGAIELAGTGNSVSRMLGTANGKIGMFVNDGRVSETLMNMVAIDLWGIAQSKLKGDRQVGIRCVVGDFGVKNGVASTNALVFDTDVVNVSGGGTVNLRDETIDLTLDPEPKKGSLASLRSPLYVTGTFSEPHVAPDVASIAARGAGAVVMGLLNPLLAVIPLVTEGPGEDSDCGKLIAELTSSARSAASGGSAARPRGK